jgi:type IV fimbrial biogenesis protein FimT
MKRLASLTHLSRGVTLIELIVVITILSILATLAIPSFVETIKTNRVISQNNELVALLNFAKTEAIRRSADVSVFLGGNNGGWSGAVRDPQGDETVAGCAVGVIRCAENSRVALTISPEPPIGQPHIVFNNRGYTNESLSGFGEIVLTLVHENCTSPGQRRRIELLATGQVSSCPRGCNDARPCREVD